MARSPKPDPDLMIRSRTAAIVLAAGEGRRMGGVAKPLIRLQGVPLIERQLVALTAAGVNVGVVVTGFKHEAVAAQARRFPFALTHNAHYALGQQSSVRLGLSALTGHFDTVLMVLADQPLITAADLLELMTAFNSRPRGHVMVPTVEGQRGNPVLIDSHVLAQVLASAANLGCRHLIDNNPDLVYTYETANTHFTTDLDTLQDVTQLAQRTGWLFELPGAQAPG